MRSTSTTSETGGHGSAPPLVVRNLGASTSATEAQHRRSTTTSAAVYGLTRALLAMALLVLIVQPRRPSSADRWSNDPRGAHPAETSQPGA